MIRHPSIPLTLCAALLGGASVALAHDVALEGPIEIPEGSTAYVNADGEAVRTGGGECLRLGGFDEESQVDACEGIEAVVAEPEPEPEPVAPPPVPEPIARVELREVDERALFEFDSADLTLQGQAEMVELIEELEQYDGVTDITVTGHTDSTGPEEYNQGLSELRAATVGALMTTAYPDARITLIGRGESDPIASNDTPEGRQMNRRVEIELTAAETTTLE